MMDKMISAFPQQLEEAISIGQKAGILKAKHDIHHVLICGMGGSGIGGDFMRTWMNKECSAAIVVNKDYSIPAFANKHTLAIVSSYSGNTEETIAAFEKLAQTEAQIITVTSGGDLIEKAKQNDLECIEIPGNWTSPRACLGYSIVQQLYILHKKDLIGKYFEGQLKQAIQLLQEDQEAIKEKAGHIARMLSEKLPVIYSSNILQPVVLRWRQQFNENAKSLCWHNVFPELNHNELVGWKGQYNHLAVVTLRNRNDHVRTQKRINITKEILAHSAGTYMEIWSKGKSLIEQSLYLVHLGDWVSWHLAEIKGQDAVEVKVIDFLKSELAKQ